MRERPKEEALPKFSLERGENVVAYCLTCKSTVFKGNSRNSIGNRVLRERVINHLDFFMGTHKVDVIYPLRKIGGRISGQEFVANMQLAVRNSKLS